MKNRIIAPLAFVVLAGLNTYAQLDEPWEVTWPETLLEPLQVDQTFHYLAIDRVILEAPSDPQDSFVLEATSSENMVLRLDNTIVVPVDQMYTDFPDPAGAYVLDTSLPVASFDGSFSANNGAMTYNMPIDIPKGINRMSPSIGLTYNSFGPNGLLGMGWAASVGGSAIGRANRSYYANGVTQSIELTKDDNLQLDGVRLVHTAGSYGMDGSVYETENNTADYLVMHGTSESTKWFELFRSDGTIAIYGQSANSSFKTENGTVTILWQIERITDQFGNYISYEYSEGDRSPRIMAVNYTGNSVTNHAPLNRVEFLYGEREDNNTTYHAGSAIEMNRLLKRITILTDGLEYAHYELAYAHDMKSYMTGVTKHVGGKHYHPTVFTYSHWSDINFQTSSNSQNLIGGDDRILTTADLNGDGYSDLVRGSQYVSGSPGRVDMYHFDPITEQFSFFSGFDVPSAGQFFTVFDNPPLVGSRAYFNAKTGFRFGDFNGDGIVDYLIYVTENYNCGTFTNCGPEDRYLADIFVHLLQEDDSRIEYHIDDYSSSPNSGPHLHFNYQADNPLQVGDFDGDGASDFLLVLRHSEEVTTNPIDDVIRIVTLKDGVFEHHGVEGSNIQYFGGAAATTAIDYNGDGKQDLIMRTSPQWVNTTEVYEFNVDPQTGAFHQNLLYNSDDYENFARNGDWNFGDFNGDGKTDMLSKKGGGGSWVIGMNTGQEMLLTPYNGSHHIAPQIRTLGCSEGGQLEYTLSSSSREFKLGDFNGDGLTDILEQTFDRYQKTGGILNPQTATCESFRLFRNYFIQYSNGDSFEPAIPISSAYFNDSDWNASPINDLYSGDYNGDGRTDLVDIDEWPMRFIYSNSNKNSYQIASVTNGFGVKMEFEFERMNAFNDDFVIYESAFNRVAPFREFEAGISILKGTSAPNPDGSTHTTNFKYKNPTFHREGKGFVGFSERSTYDSNAEIRIVEKYALNTTTGLNDLSQKCVSTAIDELDPTQDIIRSNQLMTYVEHEIPGIQHAKDYNIALSQLITLSDIVTEHNVVSHHTKVTSSTYTPLYQADVVTQHVGPLYFTGTDWLEESITDNDYDMTTGEWWTDYKPTRTTSSRYRVESASPNMGSVYTRMVEHTYDPGHGALISSTDDAGTINAVTSDMTYDEYGNILSSVTSSTGLHTDNSVITYDASHRFPATTTDNLGQTQTFEYHSKWGVPIESTDVWGHSVHTEYDELGRVISMVDPFGVSISTTWNWIDGPDNSGPDPFAAPDVRYEEVVTRTASPFVKTRFNRFGQKREVITQDRNGGDLKGVYSYNLAGLLSSQTDPHTVSGPDVGVLYAEYDDLHRPWKQKRTDPEAGFLTTTMTYGLDGDLYWTNTVSPDGTWRKVYTDAASKMVKSEDLGGTLVYYYGNDGNPKQTRLLGETEDLATMAYDLAGRQTLLKDPNAGATTYSHDAYGRMQWQEDAIGNRYTFNYDPNDGRLMSKVFDDPQVPGINNGQYAYDYVSYGDGLHLIEKETGPNGDYFSYEYDEYGRVIEYEKNINGEAFTSEFEYDELGRNHRTSLPGTQSPVEEKFFHPSLGYTEEVKLDGVSLWSNAQQNDLGQFTQFQRGDGHVLHQEYDYHGLPTRSYADDISIHDRSYRFNAASGNLEIRSDNRVSGYDWGIQYDGLNRLESWHKARTTGASPETQGGATLVNGTYAFMDLDYGSNGNIESKSDIGDYTYGLTNSSCPMPTSMIHAVSEVTDPDDIAGPDHMASYTGFNSIENITQGDLDYTLSYGPDDQRSRTVMNSAGTLEYERIYSGNYERQTLADGSIQEVYYISAPSGMAAIYVIEDGGQGDIYTPYTDHLGSIVAITDDSGDILLHSGQEVRMDFDPWGRHRDAATWDYETVSPLTDGSLPSWLWRGYTGHEHLDEFGLINMNGRCYDPLNGRMLAVDNYVSDATNTQAFNRYSYVLNNPLKYTDPSGENPLIVIGIMALAGAYSGGAIAAGDGGLNGANWNPGQWGGTDWYKGAGIGLGLGALAGLGITALGPIASNALFSAGVKGGGGLIASAFGYGGVGAIAGGAAGFGTGYLTDRYVNGVPHEEAMNTGWGLARYGAALGATVGMAYGLTPGGFERINDICRAQGCGALKFKTPFPHEYPRINFPNPFPSVRRSATRWVDKTYWSTTTAAGTSATGSSVLSFALPNVPSWYGSPDYLGPTLWQSAIVPNFNLNFFYPGGGNPSMNSLGQFDFPWGGIYNSQGVDISLLYQQQIHYSQTGWSFFGLFTIWRQ